MYTNIYYNNFEVKEFQSDIINSNRKVMKSN